MSHNWRAGLGQIDEDDEQGMDGLIDRVSSRASTRTLRVQKLVVKR